MMKAHTLGLRADRVVRVELFATRGKGLISLTRGFDIDLEEGLLHRLSAPLRLLGIQTTGIEVDVYADGATLIPRSMDLAIAVCIAGVQSEDCALVRGRLADMVLLGEVGPEGELLGVKGALPLLVGLGSEFTAIVPRQNGVEAAGAGIRVLIADTLQEVLDHLTGERRPLSTAPSPGTVCEDCGVRPAERMVYGLQRCSACADEAVRAIGEAVKR